MTNKKLVLIESPCKSPSSIRKRIFKDYTKLCVRDSLLLGEYPYASHLFYDQEGILDDSIPLDRRLGIEAGLVWGKHADLTAVYIDFGITEGMRKGIEEAKRCNRPIVKRRLW